MSARGIKRVVSRGNLRQSTTIAGLAAGAAGAVLVALPNPWAQIVGQVMIAVGGIAVGHDEDAR